MDFAAMTIKPFKRHYSRYAAHLQTVSPLHILNIRKFPGREFRLRGAFAQRNIAPPPVSRAKPLLLGSFGLHGVRSGQDRCQYQRAVVRVHMSQVTLRMYSL